MPAKTPRPIGRTDNFLPGNDTSAAAATPDAPAAEACIDVVEVGVSIGVVWIVFVVVKLVAVGNPPITSVGVGVDVVMGSAGELVLVATRGSVVEGEMIEVVAVVTVLDTDED